ncbi:penicillin-binding protein [Amycolatopsis coloradensis]|uniref:Penicillin-binding protein n=1 Tax=Amycolatopsis coloradensis TaxID=76021 RepID=A0A1R0L1N5_9PSEU|nr:transglycosylase domain-containing protein [Amycolatopsis coloradensis]OLZ55700.1 penicillin-binding protein [Amycolatopsis coloradensis]
MNDDPHGGWPGQDPDPARRPQRPAGPPRRPAGGPPPGHGQRPPGPQGPGQAPWQRQGAPQQPPQQPPQRPQRPRVAPQHEPDLITHHEHNGTEHRYEEPYEDDQYVQEPGEDGKPILTPAQRKKRRWRRIRRVLLALFCLFFVLPAIAFVITYFAVDVPSPQAVAATQGQAVTYYYADNTEMGKDVPKGGNRQILTPEQIPDIVKKAVIATEDASFETNSGFDIGGILRAVYNQVTAGKGGGSTISQQYIKVASGDDESSLTRKWTELAKSFKMNQTYEKKDIISAYLNIIYYGRGAYGIESAAQAFFGKPAGELNASEAALLAGLIQQPGRSENPKVANERWTVALNRMVENKFISAADRANLQFPTPIPQTDKEQAGVVNPFIRDKVKDELAANGITGDIYYTGGYKIYTTIDPKAQAAAEQAVADGMKGQTDENLLNALVAIDPKTGGVKAYYGGPSIVKGPDGQDQKGRDWANTPQNPGSSMKPFDLTAYLQMGKGGINSTFDGSNNRQFGKQTIRNAGPGSSCSAQCTVSEAMQRSANTVFYDMVVNVTKPGPVAQAAKDAGVVPAPEGASELYADNNIALGGGKTAVSPEDMAAAYATFAADGQRRTKHFVAKVTNSQDEAAYSAPEEAKPAFSDNSDKSKQIAGNVTESLKGVIPFSKLKCPNNHECAGKTGTQQHTYRQGEPASAKDSNSQTWMVGYTPSISTAVWVGGDGDKALKGKNGKAIFGSTIAGPIWQKFLSLYLNGKPGERFDQVKIIGGGDNNSNVPSTQTPPEENEDPGGETGTPSTGPSTGPSSSRNEENPPSSSRNPPSSSENNGEEGGGGPGRGGGRGDDG